MSIEAEIKSRQIALRQKQQRTGKRNLLKDKDLEEGKMELMRVVRNRITEDRSFDDILSEEAQEAIREIAWRIIEDQSETVFSYLMLNSFEKGEILEHLLQNMFGFGIIEPLLNDRNITEVMINGPERIFIEREGKMELAVDRFNRPLKFSSNSELMHVIEKIVAPINRKVDEADPIVDARLPDGSRVNVIIKPISLDGPAVTIRKFPEQPYNMKELVSFGAIPFEIADLLAIMVRARYNMVISGGTGSGKTTFLNALSMFIPAQERIVTVEDAAELKLAQAENIVRLETRPPNMEGKGAVTIRDLVRTALRMRPDRIVVGEVRGGEALDMLQAMNTGHEGSLTTGHSNSATDMLSRLETMVLMTGMELPIQAIRQQIASAIDIIIHLDKLRDGSRRVVEITEIVGFDGINLITKPIFKFRITGFNQDKVEGELIHVGNTLNQLDKLINSGEVEIPKYLINWEQWERLANLATQEVNGDDF